MHRTKKLSAAALVGLVVSPLVAAAQEVRVYQDPSTGHTVQETTQTIQRQIPVTQWQPSTRTVLRGQYRTDNQSVVRNYSVPITEYRWESYWQGRYNPFAQPTIGYRLVPATRWETHSDVVNVPVTRYETVPTTETVHLPVMTYHQVQDQVVRRTVVAPAAAGTSAYASTAPSNGSTMGGLTRLDNPPSQGSDATAQQYNTRSSR